jgi:hypothetical protein
MSDDYKSIIYPILAAFIFFSPVFIWIYFEAKKPVLEPSEFMGDRVVKVQRVAFSGEYIFTSKDGKIASTSDFRNWRWIQR